jgi:DNA-3-methyladenine glycosylase
MKRGDSRSQSGRQLTRGFFLRPVPVLARALLGMTLLKDGVGGPIVETEAYHPDEAASHAHRGRTERNKSLFLLGGHVYVYRIHQSICANVVCDKAGVGSGVLLRAIAPTHERDTIRKRRGDKPERIWTNGPGKLSAALGITLDDDGLDLQARGCPIRLIDQGRRYTAAQVEVGPRIGISKAVEIPWRFVLRP